MNKIIILLISLVGALLLSSCNDKTAYPTAEASLSPDHETYSETKSKEFDDYWYSGTGEISSYELKQERYGQQREGDIVLVFVTEPFSQKKQVKLDRPQKAGKDNVSVLKLNHIRKFNTGIYDYSIITSTFTPVELEQHPLTLKSTTSSQEWCGHTYTQLNLDGSQYRFQEFSYFESEGDKDAKMAAAILEDDLFSRIRITGGLLEGDIKIIPSTIYSRFAHVPMEPTTATITKSMSDGVAKYDVQYKNINRSLSIDVESAFPHKILGWKEDSGNGRITTATLRKSINSPYWSKNGVKDEGLREELQLLKK
jgi:hypothetical protein